MRIGRIFTKSSRKKNDLTHKEANLADQKRHISSVCVIKLEYEFITEVQNENDETFGYTNDLVGSSYEVLFPKAQPSGELSKTMIENTVSSLKLGQTIHLSMQVKTEEDKLVFSELTVFCFETSSKYYLTFHPQKFDVGISRIDLKDDNPADLNKLISEGSLMFKCYDKDEQVYYLNTAYLDFTAAPIQQQLGKGWINFINNQDRKKIREVISGAIKKRTKYSIRYSLERADNTFSQVFESGIPIYDNNGDFNGLASAIIDISPETSGKESLMLEGKEIADLSDTAPVLFKMSNSKNEFYYFSNQWIKFTGKPLKEQRDNGWLDNIHPEDYSKVISSINLAFDKRKKYGIIYRIYNGNNQLKWVHEAGIPLYESEGEFSGYISATIDITDKKLEEDERNLQQALLESERKLHNSLENSHLIAFSLDKEGKITFCNQSLLDITGKSSEMIIGQYFYKSLFPENMQEEAKTFLNDLITNKGYVDTFEGHILHHLGDTIILKLSSVVLYNAKGQIAGVTLVGENVTEKRRIEEELKKSNDQLKELFDNANDLIQIFGLNGQLLFVNKIWKEKLGYSNEEVQDLTLNDIVHPDYISKTSIALDLIIEGKNVDKFDTAFITKDGKKLYLTGGVNCSFKDGKPVEFKGIFHDITERIRAEKAQALYYKIANMTINSSNLEALFANIHQELNNIIEVNNFYVALIDKEKKKLNFPYYIDEYNSFPENKLERNLKNGITEYAMSSNKPMFLYEKDITNLEYHGKVTVRGRTPKIWLGVPLRIANRVIGIIAVQCYHNRNTYNYKDLELLDFISGQVALSIERKQKEHKIYEQSARLKAIFESSSHLIWSVDKKSNFTSFNQNYFQTSKHYSNLDSIKKDNRDAKLSETSDNEVFWKKQYEEVFNGKYLHFETSLKNKKNQEEIWKEIYLNPIYHEDGTIQEVSGIAHDITEKKLSELALSENEEKFRNIFESFQDIYFRCDKKGTIIMISPSVKEMLGYDTDFILNNNIINFYPEPKKANKLVKKLLKEKSLRNFEASVNTKDGKTLQMLCNIRLLSAGKSKVYIEGVARDVTMLKKANLELQKAKELAERSLKVKENFLANMSHEIRTPMNGIIGTIDLLTNSKMNNEQIKYVQTIKKSSETLLTILNDILDLSKIEAGKLELRKIPVNLTYVMEKLYAMFSQQAQVKDINLYYHLDQNLPKKVMVDETRLLQVLSNLTSNAIKFTDGGGSINISLKTIAKKDIRNTIKVVVSDSGIGISQDNIKKLFNSFSQVEDSSTKSFGGTGLGLAISKELCKLMGGDIGVYSAIGLGSSFWFTFEAEDTDLEIIDEDQLFSKDTVITNYFKTMVPRILLVDDNMVNRQVAGEILKKSGCSVDVAVNGQDSINKAKKNDYDIIFMDIQMPDMDGVTATKKIKALGKKNLAPIVAMTAYSMKEDKERFIKSGLDDYISKPIKASELLNKIRQLLNIESPVNVEVEEKQEEDVIINQEIVNQLVKYGGEEMVMNVFSDFEKESQEQIDSCILSAKDGNYENILINLHTLKGNAGTLGIDKVSKLTIDIEARLKKEKKIYKSLDKELDELKERFEEFKNYYPTFLNT